MKRQLAFLIVSWLLFSCRSEAQTYSPGLGYAPGAVGGANLGINPYANPYMTPYANPYLMPMSPVPGLTGFYAFSAASSITGIGSGQYSGTRKMGSTGPASSVVDESQLSQSVPGARASRYFQGASGPTTGADRYYGRHNRQFFSNRPVSRDR